MRLLKCAQVLSGQDNLNHAIWANLPFLMPYRPSNTYEWQKCRLCVRNTSNMHWRIALMLFHFTLYIWTVSKEKWQFFWILNKFSRNIGWQEYISEIAREFQHGVEWSSLTLPVLIAQANLLRHRRSPEFRPISFRTRDSWWRNIYRRAVARFDALVILLTHVFFQRQPIFKRVFAIQAFEFVRTRTEICKNKHCN